MKEARKRLAPIEICFRSMLSKKELEEPSKQ